METSPEIKNIAKALGQFAVTVPSITKDSTNPHFKSKFASLDNIIVSIQKDLSEYGLSYVQLPDGDGLTTIIMHDKSGEWIKATANLHLDKNTPQGQGSAITYMRRYALSAALGLATEDDDDGNSASVKAPQTAKTAPSATKPSTLSKADNDTIKALLAQLGIIPKTVAEAQKAVFNATGYEFAPENYSRIVFALEEKLEASQK